RLAQIARFTALREINLAQLDDTSARLRRLRAEASAAARQSAASSGGQLVGTKVVPGRFGSFQFKSGTAMLTADSVPVVAKLATLLKNNASVGVAILGHTDNSAPSEQALQDFVGANPQLKERDLAHEQLVYAYNLALSNARA